MNFSEKIFGIRTEKEFEQAALETFRFQQQHCGPYKEYTELIGIKPEEVKRITQIPFLPIELFKTHRIYCTEEKEDLIFESSGTTTTIQSTHYIKDKAIYIASFTKCFEQFYAPAATCNIYALLPNYLERQHSSLVYMVQHLIDQSCDGGFFLYDHEALIERLNRRDKTKPTILFGVSFALLDMAEQHQIDLSENVHIIETGGMKGRREEISREELHRILQKSFNTPSVHSEYGMCECLSQSYSTGEGVFESPSWMRILIRESNDPFRYVAQGVRGGVNIIDLANYYSCSFLQTQDIGIITAPGQFRIEGRMDHSDIRGCSLLVL